MLHELEDSQDAHDSQHDDDFESRRQVVFTVQLDSAQNDRDHVRNDTHQINDVQGVLPEFLLPRTDSESEGELNDEEGDTDDVEVEEGRM